MSATSAPPVRYRNLIFDSDRWRAIELRPGDIIITTPPKCGTTWTQMLCALLVFDGADFPAPLEQLSPWVDMLNRPVDEVAATLDAQVHRRIIKSHTPLDGLPLRPDVDYVVVGRDPRDVAVSWEHHMANLDLERFLELRATVVDPTDDPLPPMPPPPSDPGDRYRQFVTSEGDGTHNLAFVLHHLGCAWTRRHAPNVHLLHYADLRRDPAGELLRLGRDLGFELSAARAAELAAEATLDRMRERADEVAPSASQGMWRDPSRFIRSAGTGEWRAWVTPEDDEVYRQRVEALADPELARWVHEGARLKGAVR